MRQLKILIPMALLGIGLTSCGKDGLSSEVDFKAIPDSPLIVNADKTIQVNGDPVVIKGPWFQFRYSFKNNSARNLVVVTLKMTVTGTKDGVTSTSEHTLDPGMNCGDGEEREYIAFVPPGQIISGTDCYVDTGTQQNDATTYSPPIYETWYIDGLPATDNNLYTVQIEAQGWFEKVSTAEITERLTATAFQSTR